MLQRAPIFAIFGSFYSKMQKTSQLWETIYPEKDIFDFDKVHENEDNGIADGPCIITDLEKYLEQPFEIIYE